MSPSNSTHRWTFFRIGGFDQVRLKSAADLAHLDQLDQKLWGALACPTRGLDFDSATLDLVDTDKDGRIRAPEIIAAARWAVANLKNPDELFQCPKSLPLASINDATPEGKQLLASAKQILSDLGKGSANSISVEDSSDSQKIFAQTKFNGDGVIPAEAAEDAAVRKTIEDVIACCGSVVDRSGKPGVDAPRVEQFYADCAAFAAWQAGSGADPAILPLGAATGAADAAVRALAVKLDDYFARCRLAAFDARAAAALNRSEAEYVAMAAHDLSASGAEVAGFPLAHIAAGKPLPLREGLNPAWSAAVAALREAAVEPLLGKRTELSEADWAALQAKLAPFRAWSAGKAGASVESLGLARVREVLAQAHKAAILALIAKDKALEPEANAIAAVDRLVRYHRDLFTLLKNFVNFEDFYDGGERSVFQCGTLYLDQRSCELVIRVEDMARHASLAGLSKCYLAYCDCVRKHSGEKMSIVAAFTGGDSDNLMVGRNGVFYDRRGRDWDATITKIIENPISLRQAFWSPYKKVAALIESQIEKFASAREKSVHEAAAAGVEQTAQSAQGAAAAAKKEAFDVAKFAGIFAAIGLALGAIGGAVGGLLAAFLKLEAWQMPLALVGLLLVISGPSMLLAWLKLRQRNLGPILDANGWAVNARAKINVPFGESLTGVPKLPAGSERQLADPYAEKTGGRNLLIAALVALVVVWGLWNFGVLHKVSAFEWLPKSSYLEKREKAAAEAAAAAAAAAAPAGEATPAAPAAK